MTHPTADRLPPEIEDPNAYTREAWDANAAFWDERMGEGNDFVRVLTWPPTERLLDVRPGQRVLDVACGNGLTSRRLAALGARVTAIDFAEEMIARARAREPQPGAGRPPIDYRVVDATDEAALLALGEGEYDAALCAMALFDMAEIDPLLDALARLLKPGGRFVFSVLHPCFNGSHVTHVAEMADREGQVVTEYSMRVHSYMTPRRDLAAAIRGQPQAQIVFHRPLGVLLGACFRAGFVLDAIEERAFPPDHPQGSSDLTWGGHYAEFPPVLVARVLRG